MNNNDFFNDFKSNIDIFVDSNFYYISNRDIIKQNAYIVFNTYYKKYFDKVYIESLKQVLYKHFYFQVLANSLNNNDLLDYEDRVKLSRKVISNMNRNSIPITYQRLMEIYCLNERTSFDILNYADEEYKQGIYKSKKDMVYYNFEDDVISNISIKKLSKKNVDK